MSLLTLNRGEAGDNAIGPELFDPLGLIRTEELLRRRSVLRRRRAVLHDGHRLRVLEAPRRSARQVGTRERPARRRARHPHGASARADRALPGERARRPRQPSDRRSDHAGRLQGRGRSECLPGTDRSEGLRPWQPLKLYMGGMREDEEWTLRVDPAVYSPWLGDSYANFARTGLSFQRSQNGGRNDPQPGPAYGYYKRLASQVARRQPKRRASSTASTRPSPGLFATLKHPAPANAATLLGAIQREVDAAVQAFRMDDPSATVPALARGLAATRDAVEAVSVPIRTRSRYSSARNSSSPTRSTPRSASTSRAVAQPAGAIEPTGPGRRLRAAGHHGAGRPGTVVRRQAAVHQPRVGRCDRGPREGDPRRIGRSHRRIRAVALDAEARSDGDARAEHDGAFDGGVFAPVFLARPRLSRAATRSTIPRSLHQPAAAPPFAATIRYTVAGVPVEIRVPVTRREAQLPYGYVMRELAVVPAVAVTVSPRQAIVPRASAGNSVRLQVELINNAPLGQQGQLALKLPPGWKSEPAAIPFSFARPGEKSRHQFTVAVPAIENREYTHRGGRDRRRPRVPRRLRRHRAPRSRDAIPVSRRHQPRARRRREDRAGPEGRLHHGRRRRCAGGDRAARGAGAAARATQDLAAADLGTVRRDHDRDARLCGARRPPDLQPAAARLREERRQPHRPLQHAGRIRSRTSSRRIRVKLPRNAEEVSEEDSPVEILAPARPEFTTPNAITKADFDGWVEQRGSKFFSEWDRAYTPMIETHDQGQPPQQGGWLTATLRQGPLHLLRLCVSPPAAVGRARRVSAAGQPAVVGEGPAKAR